MPPTFSAIPKEEDYWWAPTIFQPEQRHLHPVFWRTTVFSACLTETNSPGQNSLPHPASFSFLSSSRCDLPWSSPCITYIVTVMLLLSLKLFSRLECLPQHNTHHPGPHGHPSPRSLAQQQGNKRSAGTNFSPLWAVNITEPKIFSCKIQNQWCDSCLSRGMWENCKLSLSRFCNNGPKHNAHRGRQVTEQNSSCEATKAVSVENKRQARRLTTKQKSSASKILKYTPV